MHIMRSRRDFITTLSAAGAAGILGAQAPLAGEGPPETTAIRIFRDPAICTAPGYISGELLRAEGFTDLRYVSTPDYDFKFETAAWVVSKMDAGEPIVALAGLHPGCYELLAHRPIGTISDLRGKRVGMYRGGGSHLFLMIMLAQVGLDPHHDVDWVAAGPTGTPKQLFVDREVDAFLGFPPEPQELRARKIGRVLLKTATDKPWSDYFCCIAFGNKGFVRDHPVATKRALRAVLKAADVCAAEPETAAQRLVEGGWTPRYDYALEALTELPYASWREFAAEDTLRFFALRLHEVGMIRSTPEKILAEGTDWRFLSELKRELKA